VDVGKVLSETAERIPHKTAVIFKDAEITFAQLDLMATRLANKLKTFNMGRGDPVAIVLPNSSHWVVSYFAVMRLGAIAVPLDFRFKGEELISILSDASVRVVITSDLYPDGAVFSKVDSISKVIFTGEKGTDSFTRYEDVVKDESLSSEVSVDIREEQEALYLYTSGTTGKPKGVVLTFSNLDLFPEGMNEVLGTREEDILGCLLPMSHISGPIICNEFVIRGSSLFIFDQLRPDKILSAVEKHKVTYFHSVPPIFEAILHVPHKERFDVGSLRFVAMMGTSVPIDLLNAFKRSFPSITVIQGYGLTETSPFITLLPLEYAESKIGSIGRAVPRAEVKLVNDTGEEVPASDIGELIVRGPMLMKCYHNNPEATRERIKEGWLYTGDLCRKDDDGFFYHVGRKDDMIIVGGLNVYPAEIEQVLRSHPLVHEVGVVGIPDKDRGEIIKAAVVVSPGEQVTKKEILTYCKERLANFKIPKILEFRDELPRSSTGKIARRLLVPPHSE
jgi:long-chain acyl-CoA synthetase